MEEKNLKKPIYKKWWFWVIIVCAFIFIVPSICSDSDDNTDNNENNNIENNETNNSNNQQQNKKYGLNDKVVVKDLEFTILNINNTKNIGGTYGEDTDNNFVVVTIQIKNNSTSEKHIYDNNFVYYRSNNEYKPHSAGIYLDNGFWLNETIGAGLSKTIQVVYEIPSHYESTDYVLVQDSYKSEKIYLK